MENMEIYESSRSVPTEAQKPIEAGRLKGMTDIAPMWRIKKLTELFGPCGIGWYFTVDKEWIEEGYDGEKSAFVDISLFVKVDGEWSKPIFGNGGSGFVKKERNGLYTSDEAFKMATTDAISVACKSLGFGADIYWSKDRTKYSTNGEPEKITATTDQAKSIEWAQLRSKVMGYITRHGFSTDQVASICKKYKVGCLTDLSAENCRDYISYIKSKGGNIDE